ncbi:hypothetical protein SDC9_55247 [bioreactor metagenome]|uniref:Uncharacterized protein n=1 Tax=bioreactor metagenome TaxID=1076179 RepID=A0A644WZ97_9ZZZZ
MKNYCHEGTKTRNSFLYHCNLAGKDFCVFVASIIEVSLSLSGLTQGHAQTLSSFLISSKRAQKDGSGALIRISSFVNG